MRVDSRIVWNCWSGLLICSSLIAQARADDVGPKLNEYLDACVEVERFNGSVLVSRDDQSMISRGCGLANHEHQVPNTPQTKFRLGSVTKQFTATAILLLADQGKLGVNDPVSKHYPDAPQAWEKVTIHHLLSHTSGIPSFTGFPDYPKTWMIPASVNQIIARFKDKALEFVPGEKWSYSNSGYVLLGAIIERVSGQTYETFLDEKVLKASGLHDTGYDHHTTILAHRATGYDRQGESVINSPYLDMSIPHGAGALYSTVEDLSRWDRALVEGKLLSPESFKKLFTPVKNDYAYGWLVKDQGGRREISHGGGINGFNTYLLRAPEEKLCVVVLSNVVPAQTARMAHDLLALARGETRPLPRVRKVAQVDPKLYDSYVGRYAIAPEFVLTVTREENRLMVQATGQPKFELFPDSETEFFLKMVEAQLSFVKDDKGRVTHAVLHQGGRDQKAQRLEAKVNAEAKKQ